ncbi:hypothetical protein BDV98DRAFT_601096 [Pterulicium gracile]|uniref:DUF1776-domain-containing protein n=1 Tax=Pterulicium gracile TaxID=1884261 RepID=A0A5C3QWK4_9AGAR|nr:hypothetical protein BDV98DRAFT_601096 [Pterula gracilis]
MASMVPTVEEIEGYLASVEELVQSSLAAATTDLPSLTDAVNRLWADIARYGPNIAALPEVKFPRLGDFEVPLPPSHHAAPKSWSDKSMDWISSHRGVVTGIALGTVGVGLYAGYTMKINFNSRRAPILLTRNSTQRRKVVVVLGGDVDPLGLPLILELEKTGFIVIASVSTPEAVDTLESQTNGYVRALVLDPTDPATVPIFMRSLFSTLSRRFPLGTAGDPHASPASQAYVHSLISLITLPTGPIHAPLERIPLETDYMQYLNRTHVTPLHVIQSILPFLRSNPARARDTVNNDAGSRSIVVCLPAADTRVGLLFGSAQAMSAAATSRGIEVLRREITAAALTDRTESMKHIKVVTVDVGTFDTRGAPQSNGIQAMEGWSASEKLTYGPAFASISHDVAPASSWKNIFRQGYQYGVPRKPTGVSAFVLAIVNTVDGGRNQSSTVFGINFGLGKLVNLFRGDRFSLGAGATTYKLASLLPTLLLDSLLNLPHLLVSIRNSLLPVEPFVVPPSPLPLPGVHQPDLVNLAASRDSLAAPGSSAASLSTGSSAFTSEAGSEADVESNSGEVEQSWVQLKDE